MSEIDNLDGIARAYISMKSDGSEDLESGVSPDLSLAELNSIAKTYVSLLGYMHDKPKDQNKEVNK